MTKTKTEFQKYKSIMKKLDNKMQTEAERKVIHKNRRTKLQWQKQYFPELNVMKRWPERRNCFPATRNVSSA